ncbi:MAG: FtsH protease activity modulator HflK [Thioalkalivibrionaceae bacterium]
MPWNEPGNNQRDPWSGGGGSSGNKGGSGQQPPDLEEMLRKVTAQINGIFGGRGNNGDEGGGRSPGGQVPKAVISLGLIVAVLIWLGSGFHIVSEGDRGVVTRFGAFVDINNPGPHWHLPYPIENVEIVTVDTIRTLQNRALMLTRDENIIDVDIAVQYRVSDARDFLFNVRDPDQTVRQVMEAAIRERVGNNTLDFILGEGRAEIATSARVTMQNALDNYGTGVFVTTVSMQQAQPPEPVQEAFADAIRAREDEVRFRNEAEAYANGLIPRARGQAARILEEAEAYRDQVIARADGDASRFSQLLVEFSRAPEVTRDRLYIETMESVFRSTNKVFVDVGSSNNVTLLPLDALMRGGQSGASSAAGASTNEPSPLDFGRNSTSTGLDGLRSSSGNTNIRPDLRSREVR